MGNSIECPVSYLSREGKNLKTAEKPTKKGVFLL
jgi:hypothetical protein